MVRLSRPPRFLLSAYPVLVFLLLATQAARAATPPSGEMSPGQTSVAWSGGPFSGSTSDPLAADCNNSECDDFILTVTGTDATVHTITAAIEWLNPTNDLDLHVFNHLTGCEIGVDGQAIGNTEEFSWSGAPGVYRVSVLAYRAAGESYTGSATLTAGGTPEPSAQFRSANYQRFDFGFTPEVKLPEQERSLVFTNQDVEPEIEVDRFGTIYIGAIRGVPGGVDFWRSDDGGATFRYMGEPDGLQNPTPVPEGGVGGGDVDISLGDPFFVVPPVPGVTPGIRSTGRVYCSSLWLGSATMAVSTDRGENWAPFPFTTAQLDRQWHVARGEKTLYMSLRKLAQIELGQHDVYVTQSDDGGMTFPKGSFVQDPLGDGVPDDLAGNCVLTSDGALVGSFVSRDGRDLYVYRAPRGNAAGPAELPPGPLDVPVFVPSTFDAGLVFHGTRGITTNNVFPIMSADRADNLHLVFSDRHDIYLMSCPAGSDPTQAGSWTLPVRLNAPGVPGFEFTRTALFPWVRAGAPGKMGVIWYATDAEGDADCPGFEQANVPWRLVYAQVENALSDTPDIYLDVASTQGDGVIHTGQICTRGLGCPDGTRELAEYSSVTLDNEGFANIAYAGTIIDGQDPGGTAAITFFTKSTRKPVVDLPVVTRLECHDEAVSRKGGWHDVEDDRATNGHYCRNVKANGNDGSWLEFDFTGFAVDIQIARGPRGGNAEVFLDGVSQGRVDFWRAPSDPSHPDHSGRKDLSFGEFVTFETTQGTHTLRLVVRNDSPDPQRDMVYIDGIVITGQASGTGNPTETASLAEGTSGPADPLGGLAGAVSQAVTAGAGTVELTGVLEVADGANLDLLLVDPLGATVARSQTTNATEVVRFAPTVPGTYAFLVVNRGSAASRYRLDMIRTVSSGHGGVLAAAMPAGREVRVTGPVNGEASISFAVRTPGSVTIRIFNVAGQLLRTLSDEAASPGVRTVRWDGTRADGQRVPSGVYFYKLTLPDRTEAVLKASILR